MLEGPWFDFCTCFSFLWPHIFACEVLIKRKKKFDTSSSVSVRRFSSFGLLHTKLEAIEEESHNRWYCYTWPNCDDLALSIRHLNDAFDVSDLTGFNNTGNVCVWPSEEILTYYALQNKHRFKGANVIELGGGMTCLAGVALAVASEAEKIVLTDGNEKSTQNLQVIINRNTEAICETKVSARTLLWNELDSLDDVEEMFDFVICADCLFFDNCREDLVKTVYKLLKFKGEAIMFAPMRGTTFDQFMELARASFSVEKNERYDDNIWNLHTQNLAKGQEAYDADIHYPLFLRLVKDLI